MSLATIDEIEDLSNHPEILLIDVRDPPEISSTGSIPTSINIPCKDHLIGVPFWCLYQRNFHCNRNETVPFFLFYFCHAVGTLEETLKLSESEFKGRFGRDKPTDDTAIIFSCKLGGRATKAAEIAIALGFENSRVFKGSWTEWAAHKNL